MATGFTAAPEAAGEGAGPYGADRSELQADLFEAVLDGRDGRGSGHGASFLCVHYTYRNDAEQPLRRIPPQELSR